jgi:hypothetical protein
MFAWICLHWVATLVVALVALGIAAIIAILYGGINFGIALASSNGADIITGPDEQLETGEE